MNPKQINKHKNDSDTISKLDRFNLGFEYDKTLQQLKREIKAQTV